MRWRTVLGPVAAAVLVTGCPGDTGSKEPAPRALSPSSSASPSPSPSTTPTPLETPTVSESLTVREQAALNEKLRDAAWANDVALARELIQQGADVNAKDETEQSAYLITTSEGYLRLLELTLRNGAHVNSKDSFNGTGLIRAAERGHADVVGRLVRAGIALDHVNELGWTALHEAVILGDGGPDHQAVVRILLQAGADPSIPDNDGVTALEHAEAKGQDEVARIIRRVGS